MRAFVTGRAMPSAEPIDLLKQTLVAGIDEAYTIVVILALAGALAIAIILLALHVPLRAPDLQKFDEGASGAASAGLTGLNAQVLGAGSGCWPQWPNASSIADETPAR